METVWEFTYLGDRVSAGGGCEAAVKFMEWCELLYGRRFPLRLNWVVVVSYVRPAIMCGSEAWCLKESDI